MANDEQRQSTMDEVRQRLEAQQTEPGLMERVAHAPFSRRVSRAGLLKGMALTTAGAAAASAGVSVGSPGIVAAAGPNPQAQPLSPTTPAPALPTVAGTTYDFHSGTEFLENNSAAGYASGGSGDNRPVTSLTYFNAMLHLPQGVSITEVLFFVTHNSAGTMNAYLASFTPSMGGGNNIAGTAVPTVSSAIQTVTVPLSSPPVVDNANNVYFLGWYPGAVDGSQKLWGARVGYINKPGLVTFPASTRVFGDGSVTPAGTTTAAIDATAAGVPAGATSAYCAVQATAAGVMTLFPDGSTDPGIANWANTGNTGQLALFYMLVPLSAAGKFKIHSYLTGQIYVDVWGYLL